MFRYLVAAVALLAVSLLSSEALAQQSSLHRDGYGATFRSGNTTTSVRADGSFQQWHRWGNMIQYRDSRGNTGTSLYGTAGQLHSYANPSYGRGTSTYYHYNPLPTYRAPNYYGFQPW